MSCMRKLYKVLFLLLPWFPAIAQEGYKEDQGQFSGNFQTNNQFYLRDDRIGANTTQYLHEKSSSEAWLFMNYKFKGFSLTARYDLYNNSPLFNPKQAYSRNGLGFWQVSKDIENFNITVGYFYEQFGSGSTFRAYEDRNIGIDFAIQGARVIYTVDDNTKFKAFTGQQKYRFDIREPIIKGINGEHRFNISDELSDDLGLSVINRTLDQATMNTITTNINTYALSERFNPKYNVYAFQVYNTVSYKNVSVMLEYDVKTPEAILDLNTKLINSGGRIYFASFSYSSPGLGINAQFKRIETFPMQVDPLEKSPTPNNGPVNYLPSITRQNTYRLLARYNSVIQSLGENASQLEITYKPDKKTQINLNTSVVVRLPGVNFKKAEFKWDSTTRLFREFYLDIQHKFNKTFKMMIGIQAIGYNQSAYELKGFAPYVEAITPFGEFTYKLNTSRSLRMEWQYMTTTEDLGSFLNGLLEYNMAPHWSFSVGDLLNYKHGALNEPAPGKTFELVHYFNLFAAYTYKTSRFSCGFLKQPTGVNCTGGVCRVEPAFSGFRIGLTTNF